MAPSNTPAQQPQQADAAIRAELESQAEIPGVHVGAEHPEGDQHKADLPAVEGAQGASQNKRLRLRTPRRRGEHKLPESSIFTRGIRYVRGLRHRFLHRWRTSLQVRVLGSILVASAAVMLVVAFVLVSFITQRLISSKLDIANSEIDRARVAVETQIDATGTASSTFVRMQSARAALVNQSTTAGEHTTYEPVLVVNNPDGTVIASPEGYRIPERLRSFVSQGQIAYQFVTIERESGSPYKALIIGSPTQTDIQNLQVYLVLSMEQEESTLAMLRGLFSAAAIVLVVLLVGIAWLLTQQVITPVRSASRIAERFRQGHLRERMVVDGEDEVARLAVSFNSMAESLSKQIRQLEEYGDLQKQFTSDVSHELRSPLTTVRMAADLIMDDAEHLPITTRRASELMVNELDRFEALLSDLLEISRHDAGVADLAAAKIDLRSCVQSAVEQTWHIAEQIGAKVIVEEPDQPVVMVGDSRRIERVLRNLVANALDHSEGNPVVIRVAANDQAAAVAVIDHGVGLELGQEDLVFNRFWRADPSRVRHSGGTGLGLAIAKEDALLHGGTLDAAGNPKVGTMFRLCLPLEPKTPFDVSPIPLRAPSAGDLEDLLARLGQEQVDEAAATHFDEYSEEIDEAELAAAYDPDLDDPDIIAEVESDTHKHSTEAPQFTLDAELVDADDTDNANTAVNTAKDEKTQNDE